MPDRTVLRALRVTVFAAVCVVLAATGHWLEAGRQPAVAPLVLGGGIALFVANRLAGRERSLTAIGASVVGIQAVLHVVFVLCDTGDRGATGAGMGGHGVHAVADAAAAASAVEPRLGMSAGMALAHLIGAVTAAVWLRRGEAALWSLCRWLSARTGVPLRLLLALLAAGAPGPDPVALPRARRGGRRCRTRLLRHAVSRRGPPCTAVSF
jgi:hypothetical protein